MNSAESDHTNTPARTVADLLAAHGRSGVPSGGGRRRRAEDAQQAGAQEIIDRVLGNDGDAPAHGGSPAALAGRPPQHAAVSRLAELPRSLDQPTDRLPRIGRHPLDTASTAEAEAPPPAPTAAPPPREQPPQEAPSPTTRRRWWRAKSAEPASAPSADEPATAEPARDDVPSSRSDRDDVTSSQTRALPVTTAAPVRVDEPDDLDAELVEPDTEPDSESDSAEDPVETEESPTREWLVMTSQLAVGAVGGAGLWLGFQWLWRTTPVVALVLALLVITALVWAVRRIRRSDDLQTTVVTVLVGLFVTVSPAALLLVDR